MCDQNCLQLQPPPPPLPPPARHRRNATAVLGGVGLPAELVAISRGQWICHHLRCHPVTSVAESHCSSSCVTRSLVAAPPSCHISALHVAAAERTWSLRIAAKYKADTCVSAIRICCRPSFSLPFASRDLCKRRRLRGLSISPSSSFILPRMSVSTTRHVIVLGESNCGKVRAPEFHSRHVPPLPASRILAERTCSQNLRHAVPRRIVPHAGRRLASLYSPLAFRSRCAPLLTSFVLFRQECVVKISGGSRAAIRLWDTSASGTVALRPLLPTCHCSNADRGLQHHPLI